MSPPDPRASRDPWLWLSLLLGLAVRLIALDEPLIDHQAWRQTETAAIARNFFEEGFDLLHPRVDWRGTTEGYVEMNFPLYPFLVACLYWVLGYPGEWVGRLLAALFSTATAGVLYQLARRLYDRIWVARLSAVLFLVTPLSLFFGRAFMTEALMIFLSVSALMAFLHWLERPGYRAFGVAATVAALCFAVKIPTLYMGFPLVALAWCRWGGGQMLKKPALWAFLAVSVAPSIWWYWHAAGLFQETGLTFGIWNRYGYNKWATADLLLSADFHLLMAERVVHRALTPIGLGLALWGLAIGLPRSNDRPGGGEIEGTGRSLQWMPFVWLGGLLLYVIMVPEGNRRLHYYQLPLVPVGALFAALPLARLIEGRANSAGRGGAATRSGAPPRRGRQITAAMLLAGICGYSAWSVIDYYRPPNNVYEYYRSCWEAGKVLDAKLPSDALLVIGDYDLNAGTPYRAQSPTLLYYCHRKGWQITPDDISDERLTRFARLGADYFVAASGLIGGDKEKWRALQSRGLTFPSAHPRFWYSSARFLNASRADKGPDRHVVVVALGANRRSGS